MRTILFLLLATTVAHADAKYTRKPALHIDVKQTPRTKPLPAPTSAPAAKPTADGIMLAEERTEPLRKEQEQMLLELIRDTPDTDPDKPDYFFRLAEHYAQQLRLWRLKANELDHL